MAHHLAGFELHTSIQYFNRNVLSIRSRIVKINPWIRRHGTSEILAYLFPQDADFIRAVGKEAGDSRIWAGIHYQMDNVAGVQLGKSVAQVFVSRAESDGSQLSLLV